MQPPKPIPDPAHALLVEDDPVTREFLCETLLGAGWQVEWARNVAGAIAKGRRQRPALLLCDLRLPDGDAFDVARALWADAATAPECRPFAVALSADLDANVRERLQRAGFQVVLSKPVGMSDLIKAIAGAPTGASSTAGDLGEATILDDAAALSVCGDLRTVGTLRELLARELPAALHDIRQAHDRGDHACVDGILHRLRSASGFCGAAEFGAALARARASEPHHPQRPRELANILEHGEALVRHLGARVRR